MEHIKSLIDLLGNRKIRQVTLIDELQERDTKIGKFYGNLKNGLIYDDNSAKKLLYDNKESTKSYKKLKNRLYSRLVNSVFFINQTNALYDNSLNAAVTSYKNYAAIRLLIGNRKRGVAIDLAHKTLKYSRKFDFTDLNYLLTSLMANHYLSIKFDKKKYSHFKKLKEYYLKALSAESEIEDLLNLFNSELSKSSSGLSELEFDKHLEIIDDIKIKQKQINTYRYNLFAYLYQINFLLEARRYDEIIFLYEEAISFFEGKGLDTIDVRFFLKIRAAIAFFMLKEYDLSKQYFLELNEKSIVYSVNWYSTLSYVSSIYFNVCEFNDAYRLLSLVINSKAFNKTHPLLVQQFKIKEAYIHFLVELGKINPEESEEKPLRKFRLNRFLNDVPTYSKDKRGVNISILIIQMILLVQNKKHGQIIDKLDALNMYSHRYLRSDNTFRSNCFIKMLTKLPDADYHPIRWQRYVKKFRDRLDEHPFELSYHNLDLEVIPFETLYDLVVEMLYQQKGMEVPA